MKNCLATPLRRDRGSGPTEPYSLARLIVFRIPRPLSCRRRILPGVSMPRLLGSLALIGLAACSNRPHAEPMPIQLQGEPMAAMPSLSGDWSGGYWNGSAGRHGSLKFFVGIGEDSTFGDVTMVSPYGDRPQPADQGA